jgi:hypothetical protein
VVKIKQITPYGPLFRAPNKRRVSGKESGFARKIDAIFSKGRGPGNEVLAYSILVHEVREELSRQGIDFAVRLKDDNAPGRDLKITFNKPDQIEGRYLFLEIKSSLEGIKKHRERGYRTRAIIVNGERRRKTIIHAMKNLLLHEKRRFEEESKQRGGSN